MARPTNAERAARAASAAQAEDIGAPLIREVEKPKHSGTVTVACKIPMGLQLQLQHPTEQFVPTGRGIANDYQKITVMVFGGPKIHVFGPSIPAQGGVPEGYILPPGIEGDYALTPGIPADFWSEWLEQNKKADYVTSKMIFAFDAASTKAAAREHAELKSGLEPLSRARDKEGRMLDRRIPKPINGSVGRIAYDAERTAQQTTSSRALESISDE
jgi:hypothetical protein